MNKPISHQEKVFISTLSPLGGNYGGLLQAFALQKIIKSMGYDAVTDNSIKPVHTPRTRLGQVRRTINKKLFGKMPHHIDVSITPEYAIYTNKFITKRMQTIDSRSGRKRPSPDTVSQFTTFIVGSDQVWRAGYTDVPFQLFDYVKNPSSKMFSYAASFGRDDTKEYTPSLINKTAKFARRLRGVSVREDSGVKLAQELWGLEAQHHIDPTLLLSTEEYVDLVKNSTVELKDSSGKLFVYVLDKNASTTNIINKVERILNIDRFEILPKQFPDRKSLITYPEKFALPPVEQWIKSFMDAQFIITDSFHGSVFAIIFNKPFITIGNASRGMARFSSLMNMFGLNNRLITDANEITKQLLQTNINWELINRKIKSEQQRSRKYLNDQLSRNPRKHEGGQS